MSKAKNVLRTFCWFPGMDKVVENQARECLPCQAVHPANTDQPVKPSELPSGPWQYVEIDFQGQHNDKQLCGLYLPIRASRQYVSRTTDHHSSYRKWQTSPNREDILTMGVTPEWPRANSSVERFNRTMKTALQAANLEGTTLRDAAQCFIQIYIELPHIARQTSARMQRCTTGERCEWYYNRSHRSTITWTEHATIATKKR